MGEQMRSDVLVGFETSYSVSRQVLAVWHVRADVRVADLVSNWLGAQTGVCVQTRSDVTVGAIIS